VTGVFESKRATPQTGSLLAPYRTEYFVTHDAWRGLKQILSDSGGGSYGISGPRGAGKTWMMERALAQAENEGGMGVWFPSPSEYEPISFLAAISDVVAARFEAYYDQRTHSPTRTARGRFLRTFTVGFALAYVGIALLVLSPTGSHFVSLTNLVLILMAFGGLVISAGAFRQFREGRAGLGRVRVEAEDLRTQVRYTVTARDNEEAGLNVGYGGLGALLKRARERELIERPATLSSLIHNFRAFAEAIAKGVDGPVVIAIDELDKMSDSSRVAQLLRDIKGIFEIPGVYFLVSLSDEAAQALDLGSVRTRDEFNSSFYTVIALPLLDPGQCREVLAKRGSTFDADITSALAILSGGVSREFVRIADLVRLRKQRPSVGEAVSVAVEEELRAFYQRVIETADASGPDADIGDDARLAFCGAIETALSALNGDASALRACATAGWDLGAQQGGLNPKLEEEWRRLLVRLAIAGVIDSQPELLQMPESAAALQRVVQDASTSAAVGRWQLERIEQSE
jgi:hypothetical protein